MSSYLPSGVFVNCTFMTKSTPNHLGISRKMYNVVNKNRDAILLNIDDKKIDVSFSCKSPAKFWDGLAALCIGIAIGVCIAAAVVLTAGAAAVVIAAVVVTAAVASIVSVGVGIYQQAHDCDCTLKSPWKLFHKNVKLNKNNALLQTSQLHCTKGGIIQPFINPVIAAAAAEKFSDNNNAEVLWQVGSEFAIGVVAGLSTLGDPAAVVLTAGFTPYEYATEYDEDERSSFEENLADAGKDTARDVGYVGGGPTVYGAAKEAGKTVTEMNENIVKELIEQGADRGTANALKDAFGFGMETFGKEAGINMAKGFGAGLAGAAINFGIAQGAKHYKLEHINAVRSELQHSQTGDSKNNIQVIAKNG